MGTRPSTSTHRLPPPTRAPRLDGTACACLRARSPYTGREADERAARASRAPTTSHYLDSSAARGELGHALARLLVLWSDLAVELPAWLAGELSGDPDGALFWLQVRLEDVRDGAAGALACTHAMQHQLDDELDAQLAASRRPAA